MTNRNNPRKDNSMGAQLQKILRRPQHSLNVKSLSYRKLPTVANMPPVGQWQRDGGDHINISRDSLSGLGIALAPSFSLPFEHSKFGPQKTISAIWSLIDEYLGSPAIYSNVVNLPLILVDALWQRVLQYPKLQEALKANELPFDMYDFNNADLPTRKSMGFWWIEGVNRIVAALRTDATYPDFSSLMREGRTAEAELIKFLEEYIPNRRSAKKAAKAKDEVLVRTLRETPPIKMPTRPKFSMTIPHQNVRPRASAPVEPEPVKVVAAPASELLPALQAEIKVKSPEPADYLYQRKEEPAVEEKVVVTPSESKPEETAPVVAVEETPKTEPQPVVKETPPAPAPAKPSAPPVLRRSDMIAAREAGPVVAKLDGSTTIADTLKKGSVVELDLGSLLAQASAENQKVEEAEVVVNEAEEEKPLCSPETDVEIEKVILSGEEPAKVAQAISTLLMEDDVFKAQLKSGDSFEQQLDSGTVEYTVLVHDRTMSVTFAIK